MIHRVLLKSRQRAQAAKDDRFERLTAEVAYLQRKLDAASFVIAILRDLEHGEAELEAAIRAYDLVLP